MKSLLPNKNGKKCTADNLLQHARTSCVIHTGISDNLRLFFLKKTFCRSKFKTRHRVLLFTEKKDNNVQICFKEKFCFLCQFLCKYSLYLFIFISLFFEVTVSCYVSSDFVFKLLLFKYLHLQK